MVAFTHFSPIVTSALTSVGALQTAFPDKGAAGGRSIAIVTDKRDNFSRTCVIQSKSLRVSARKSWFPGNYLEADRGYQLSAELTMDSGDVFTIKYAVGAGDKWSFRSGPVYGGKYIDVHDNEKRLQSFFAGINPFSNMLRAIREKLDNDAACGEIAEYIEGHPDYWFRDEPPADWLRKYMVERRHETQRIAKAYPGCVRWLMRRSHPMDDPDLGSCTKLFLDFRKGEDDHGDEGALLPDVIPITDLFHDVVERSVWSAGAASNCVSEWFYAVSSSPPRMMVISTRSLLSVMPFLTLVAALRTASPNKVAPSARDVSLIEGDSSHTCVIRYDDVNLYVERSKNPAVEKKDHYYSIKAEVTKTIGGKLYAGY